MYHVQETLCQLTKVVTVRPQCGPQCGDGNAVNKRYVTNIASFMIFVNNLCLLFRFCSIYYLKSDIDAGFCYLKHDIVFF